jgi:hypothetical protein
VRQVDAETIALKALAWLTSDQDMLKNFCGATGADPRQFRSADKDPAFLAGVLDFLCLDDEWLVAFAEDAGIPPERSWDARTRLSGDLPHWT